MMTMHLETKHPYTLEEFRETETAVMSYEGLGWLFDSVKFFKNHARLSYVENDGYSRQTFKVTQDDLDRAFKEIIEARFDGELHDQHFNEVMESTPDGWDWIIRFATKHGCA